MNIKLHKQNKRVLKMLWRLDYRIPYQVVLDDEFLTRFNMSMLRLRHLIHLFRSEPKLFITRCIYRRYRDERREFKHDLSGYCEIIKCKHTEVEDPERCLRDTVKRDNRHHYILAYGRREVGEGFKDHTNVPMLTCIRGHLRLKIDESSAAQRYRLTTEAAEGELDRLEQLFNEEQ
jgi:U3 small nucleolar RNA-associated protein 23